ncbi:anti-sigma factor [Thalassotalea sp. 1_MG-2023]|uniref:anti-sigma factor n=1 Tax=Thalassotalea sp. 1_MG-2023 TaxID=3062680 RepID=UPI0026E19815|nr:anti-sigma factor [Thalassotalea sp. 1_MG-2023]MDO6426700.1 anti-sigma factor [Thalassotalea sp. 1_MG-2023]
MNYTQSELLSSLASEYVLGTLRGSARNRFESLKVKDARIQEAVQYWESQLNVMATSIKPIEPPASVWKKIELSLGFTNELSTSPVPSEVRKQPSANSGWKAISGLAIAASFILSIMFYQYTNDFKSPKSVAVFANADQQTLWSVDVRENNLFIRSTQNLPKRPTNDYELWIVPASGSAPISLGLLKQEGTFTLPKPEVFDDVEIAALAVSIEPKGGSPTGAPTEVLFTTELALL